MQFIAIEITIMHKIQIEWNSIRHFPMGLCREGGRSPVPLWVFHWVWMQCTSSLVISEIRIKKCFPAALSVSEPSCPEPEARWLRLLREMSHLRGVWGEEAQTLQNVGVGAREMEEGGERGDEETRGVNRKLETSVPAWELRQAEAQSYQLTIYSQLCSRSQNISLFPEV